MTDQTILLRGDIVRVHDHPQFDGWCGEVHRIHTDGEVDVNFMHADLTATFDSASIDLLHRPVVNDTPDAGNLVPLNELSTIMYGVEFEALPSGLRQKVGAVYAWHTARPEELVLAADAGDVIEDEPRLPWGAPVETTMGHLALGGHLGLFGDELDR